MGNHGDGVPRLEVRCRVDVDGNGLDDWVGIHDGGIVPRLEVRCMLA